MDLASATRIARPRMAGASLTMPLIVLNMGSEMVYILQQRLRAQNIAPEKARTVIADVLRAMLNPSFLDELFRPQDMQRLRDTRVIFDKLAHSSIMRLNKSSMDKLLDLMVMGFKHQVLASASPSHLLQITLNHLEALKASLSAEDLGVAALATAAIARTVDTYARLPLGELFAARQSLARLLQDRCIKVSVFLEEGIQTPEGHIVLSVAGALPTGIEVPGTIRYYSYYPTSSTITNIQQSKTQQQQQQQQQQPVVTTERIQQMPDRGAVVVPEGNPLDPVKRTCTLGANLYLKERPSGAVTAVLNTPEKNGASSAPPKARTTESSSPLSSAGVPTTKKLSYADSKQADDGDLDSDDDKQLDKKQQQQQLLEQQKAGSSSSNGITKGDIRKSATNVAGVNMLASLLGASNSTPNGATIAFDLPNLFGDDGFGILAGSGTVGIGGGGGGNTGGNIITFSSTRSNAGSSAVSSMMSSLGLDESSKSSSVVFPRQGTEGGEGKESNTKESDVGDDLLDMMDALG